MSDEETSATSWTVREGVSDTDTDRRAGKVRDEMQAVMGPWSISTYLSAAAIETEWLSAGVAGLVVTTPGAE